MTNLRNSLEAATIDWSLGSHCDGAYVVLLSGRDIRGEHWCHHLHGKPARARACADFWASIGYATRAIWARPSARVA